MKIGIALIALVLFAVACHVGIAILGHEASIDSIVTRSKSHRAAMSSGHGFNFHVLSIAVSPSMPVILGYNGEVENVPATFWYSVTPYSNSGPIEGWCAVTERKAIESSGDLTHIEEKCIAKD